MIDIVKKLFYIEHIEHHYNNSKPKIRKEFNIFFCHFIYIHIIHKNYMFCYDLKNNIQKYYLINNVLIVKNIHFKRYFYINQTLNKTILINNNNNIYIINYIYNNSYTSNFNFNYANNYIHINKKLLNYINNDSVYITQYKLFIFG